uniref:Uncharacterized protein n=1 Tax=Arundo donax TaxID=35708 RepID=A0A0A9CET4_ARUDO
MAVATSTQGLQKNKGCDFKQWINDFVSPKDQEWVDLRRKWELDELREKAKPASSETKF